MKWLVRPGLAVPRRVCLLATVALVASCLPGCGLVDDLLGGSPLEEALEYAPAATYFDDASAWSWKVSDDVGLDEVAADLKDAGYEEAGSRDDVLLLEAADGTRARNGLYGGRYPQFLERIALFPDEHLVVSGDGVAEVVDVVLDEAASLVDDGGFEELLGAIDPSDGLGLAQLARADDACPTDRRRTWRILRAERSPSSSAPRPRHRRSWRAAPRTEPAQSGRLTRRGWSGSGSGAAGWDGCGAAASPWSSQPS